jgi:hypothetical protein
MPEFKDKRDRQKRPEQAARGRNCKLAGGTERMSLAAHLQSDFVPGLGRIYREGERNDWLFRRACALRHRGASREQIEQALDVLNRHCRPTLDAKELQKISASAARYEVGGPDVLDLAWSRAKEKQRGSKFALFIALARELQRVRGEFPAALPVQKIAGLFGCHYTFVSQLRRKAESMGLMKRIERHSWKKRRAAEFEVDLKLSEQFLTSLIRVPSDLSNKSTQTVRSNKTLIKPLNGSDKSTSGESLAQIASLPARGWRLFPCKPREKTPAIANWPERATCDAELLAQWAEQFPDSNWAVACGEGSACWVLDIDGDDGLRSCQELRLHHDHITTLATRTARGWHMFFDWPDCDISIRNSSRRLAPGLDVRGEGGYAIVPPSIHPDGHRYEWIDQNAPVSPAPDWLLAMVTEPTPVIPALKQNATDFIFGWNVARETLQ